MHKKVFLLRPLIWEFGLGFQVSASQGNGLRLQMGFRPRQVNCHFTFNFRFDHPQLELFDSDLDWNDDVKKIFNSRILWIASIFLLVFALAMFVSFSAHRTCCSEDISEDQLPQTLLSAKKGNVASMRLLFFYFDNRRENGGAAQANYWLRQAADAGDADFELIFYGTLKEHDNVDDQKLAIKYLLSAAEHGSLMAQKDLSNLYENGSGVPKDLNKARYWQLESEKHLTSK